MSKVTIKREIRINEAVASDNWDEVLRLLDQPLENAERRDRRYGLLSSDYQLDDNKTVGEVMLADNYTALDELIHAEFLDNLNEALATLSETDRIIVLSRAIDNIAYSKLAKLVNLSDKTVKRRYEKNLEYLRELLEEDYE